MATDLTRVSWGASKWDLRHLRASIFQRTRAELAAWVKIERQDGRTRSLGLYSRKGCQYFEHMAVA